MLERHTGFVLSFRQRVGKPDGWARSALRFLSSQARPKRMAQEMQHVPDMATYPDQTQLISERLLLPRALAGDHDAFILLGSMHSQQVYAIARNLSSSDGSALELTQNAFQQAWKGLSAIPPKLSFRTFVCRFLISEAVERLGHPDPSVSAWLERFLPRFNDCERLSALPWDWAELDGLARRKEFAGLVRHALAGLDAKDRAVFVLKFIEELSLDEVSAIMEIPASVVRERAHRACLLLSGYIGHLIDDPTPAQ
jgi:RNA polymerase sigma-70 factor, ECF subfamily